MKKRPFGRVDVQVSILTVLMVLFSTLCILLLCYVITYQDMIQSLRDRVVSIYEYIDPILKDEVFTDINQKEDINTEAYKEAREELKKIKETTGVMYLYTAKKTEAGDYVYVVDGLSMEEDFRYPGDAIEPEIVGDLQKALDGDIVLPDSIRETEWGKIFVTYLPIHSKTTNGVVGAIGIEFEADHQFRTYRTLIIISPVICLLCCLISTVFAVSMFRRISNPLYKDMANTDFLTKLKNRNAFEIDMQNRNARSKGSSIAIISVDLNDLKKVNDGHGHAAGDMYICFVAHTLKRLGTGEMIVYRVGGDEFAVIAENVLKQQVLDYLTEIEDVIRCQTEKISIPYSVAAGYAMAGNTIAGNSEERDLFALYKQADQMMYEKKRMWKESHQETIDKK